MTRSGIAVRNPARLLVVVVVLLTLAAGLWLRPGTAKAVTPLGAHTIDPSVNVSRADSALSAFTGKPAQPDNWSVQPTPAGNRLHAVIPGTGVFDLDASTYEVVSAIFAAANGASRVGSAALPDGSVPAPPSDAERGRASAFAAQHFSDFAGLELRSATSIDHGAFTAVQFLWQSRSGAAWLPTFVEVDVTRETSSIGAFTEQKEPVTVSTTPSVSADKAINLALTAAGLSNPTFDEPSLEVRLLHDRSERLAWRITVTQHDPSVPYHVASLVYVDAQSGLSVVAAKSQ